MNAFGMSYDPARLGMAVGLMKKMAFAKSAGWSVQLGNTARSNAAWTDRTGNARNALQSDYGWEGDTIHIVLCSTAITEKGAAYGAFLELGTRFMAPRSIIKQTVATMFPQLLVQITQGFRDINL